MSAAAIAHHRAGEQAGLAQNLEAVLQTPKYHSAAVREFSTDFITGGKTRDGAGAQIIAVGKSAGAGLMASQFARFSIGAR